MLNLKPENLLRDAGEKLDIMHRKSCTDRAKPGSVIGHDEFGAGLYRG